MKKPPPGTEERIAKMTFASIYPLYVAKVEKKGRTKKELHEVIKWLTGYDEKKLKSLIDDEVTFETFFKKCKLNPNAHLIRGAFGIVTGSIPASLMSSGNHRSAAFASRPERRRPTPS